MARTKASVGAKVASGKSSKARCSAAPSSSSTGSSGSAERTARGSGGAGNSVCPRETPQWQKPITNFFVCMDKGGASDSEEEVTASSSKEKPKKPIIESDEEVDVEKPKNKVLDETIELEPLTGDDSHKIEEYYPKNGTKGKGKGKKTKDKENIDTNVERRSSVKRDLEEVAFGEESEHASKRIKVN